MSCHDNFFITFSLTRVSSLNTIQRQPNHPRLQANPSGDTVQTNKTYFNKLFDAFSFLFPNKVPYRDYSMILDIAIYEENLSSQNLFNYDKIRYPTIVKEMKRKGYILTPKSIEHYLYKYCLLEKRKDLPKSYPYP
jgi:hypothetical protein